MVQHHKRRQSLGDILCRELLLAADHDVRRLSVDRLYHAAEAYLLEVQDDVLHALDYAGNRCELLVHAGDSDLADGETLQRGQQDATKSIADGLTVAGLQGAELETADGIGAFKHDDLVRFLKC